MGGNFMFLVITLLASSFNIATGDDFSIVSERLYETFLPSVSELNGLYELAKEYSSSLEPGGYWPDINYTDPNRVLWDAASHLNPRLLTMAKSYVIPGQPFFHDSSLFSHIELALDYWLKTNPINPNWWWNQINVTNSIGAIAFLINNSLSSDQKTSCVTIMERADYAGWTGANLVWMAQVEVYRGLVTYNKTSIAEAFNAIYGEIYIAPTTVEGIKQDGSFYQHGQQLYSGGYGADFTASILPFLNITLNTSFYLSSDALEAFGLLLLDGQQWMIIEDKWDYVVKGREITRNLPLNGYLSASLIAAVGGPRHAEFVEMAARIENTAPPITGNKHFWKSDYMIHRRQGYSASVRMYSTRTYNSECVNLEGLKSLHMADGVFSIYQTGAEYEYIFAAWDWEQIPGTTCAKGEVPMSCDTLKVLGKTKFVGGVSNGDYGAAAFDFSAALNGKLVAKKAWFFFEQEIVAFGAGISCGGCSDPIVTSINQCLLHGPVYSSASPSTPIPNGNHSLSNTWWVYHDGVGYIIPGNKKLSLSNNVQTGTWQSIGAYSGTDSKEVFNMWIDQQDGGDSYEYIVVPNITSSSFSSSANSSLSSIQLLSNSEQIQAVYHTKLQILQAVFYTPSSVKFEGPATTYVVSTNYPAIVMLVFSKGEITTYVSDPTQTLNETITVTINEKLNGKGCINEGSSTAITFHLPTGEFAGQSIAITCTM